jgi:hypothetical protein
MKECDTGISHIRIKVRMIYIYSNNGRHHVIKNLLHFTQLHFTTLVDISSSHLNFTQLHFTVASHHLNFLQLCFTSHHYTSHHFTSLHF